MKKSNFQKDDLYKIFQYLPIAVGISDLKGNIFKINKKFTKIFGYKSNEIPTVSDWFIKAYPEQAYRKQVIKIWDNDIQTCLKNNKKTKPKIYIITNKKNKVLQGEISFKLINNNILIIFNDITEKKENEVKLKNIFKESEERYRRLESNIPGMVYTFKFNTDGSHCFPYVNKMSYKLFDIKPEELMKNGNLF